VTVTNPTGRTLPVPVGDFTWRLSFGVASWWGLGFWLFALLGLAAVGLRSRSLARAR
jgi:hypothetical protein